MKILITTLIIIPVIFILIKLVKKNTSSNNNETPWPFYAKKPLSQPEQILYHRLITAIPEYIILSQVQLSRILGVKKGFKFHKWNNRINRMSIDFLVCLKDSTIIAVIELDDKSHEKKSRITADKKKKKALSDAGIKLIHWNVNTLPNENTIRQTFIK